MTVFTYQTGLPASRSGRGEPLRGAVCAELPPDVADRYLGAHGHEEPFAFATGRMICARCPVRDACLADAITHPDGVRMRSRMRAGESAHAVRVLAYRHQRERIPAARLAREALERQLAPFRGAYGSTGLRAGHFADHLPRT